MSFIHVFRKKVLENKSIYASIIIFTCAFHINISTCLQETPPHSPAGSVSSHSEGRPPLKRGASTSSAAGNWVASPEWVSNTVEIPTNDIFK